MTQAQATPSAMPAQPGLGDVEPVAHETRDRIATGFITVAPFIALGLVGWQVWNDFLRWSDVAVFLILYLLTGLGVTVGFHRHLTHRAFKTTKWLRGTLAVLGSAAIEGPVTAWVADHRKHHAFADKEGDPHSPHVGHEGGWRGALSGLFHAHMGWLFIHTHRGAKQRYAPDLMKDPVVRFVDRTFLVWALGGLGVAFLLGWLIGGTMEAAWTGLLWGGGGADAGGAPRDLQHQLPLPLLRRAALRHGRPLAQPALARPSHARGVLAQQPPRLPHVRGPRTAPAGHRPLSCRHPRAGAVRPRVGRRAREPHAPGTDERPAKPWRAPSNCVASWRRPFPERPFHLELWDGTRVPATAPPETTFHARSRDAAAHLLRAPGQLGLGRAYVSGALEPDDLDAALRLLDEWKPPPIDRATRARLALAAARACGPMRPPPVPAAELRPRGRRHSLEARRPRRAPPLRPAARVLRAVPRRIAHLQLRAVHARGHDAGAGPGGEARARLPQARPAGGPARARRGLRLGQLRDPRGGAPRRARAGHHAVRAAGRRGAASAYGSAASRIASRSGWPTIASCATIPSTPWRASAWSSTLARPRSTCTRSSLRAPRARAGGC